MESFDKTVPIISQSVFLISKYPESHFGKSYMANKLKTGKVLFEVDNKPLTFYTTFSHRHAWSMLTSRSHPVAVLIAVRVQYLK